MTNEQKAEIRKLRSSGHGYATIADALSLTKNQVSAFCRRNNLSGNIGTTGAGQPDSNCCQNCGKPLTMNLRSDDTFVQDQGWYEASERYNDFLHTRQGKILYLELGVGYNTPVIIKYPFWQMTLSNPDAVYACVNYGEAACPNEIRDRSICIDGDIGKVIEDLRK